MDGSSISIIASAVAAASTIGSIVLASLLWRMRGEFLTKAEAAAMADRIAELEAAKGLVATKGDIGELAKEVAGLRGDVQTQDARLEGFHTRIEDFMRRVEPAMNRVEQYLLDQAGKR